MRIKRSLFLPLFLLLLMFGQVTALGDTIRVYPSIPEKFLFKAGEYSKIKMGEPFYIDIVFDYTCPPSDSMLGGSFSLQFYSPNLTKISKVAAPEGPGRAVLPSPYDNVALKNGFNDGTYWNFFGNTSSWPLAFLQGNMDGNLPDLFGHAFASNTGFPGTLGATPFYEIHYKIDSPGRFCIDSLHTGDPSFDWAFGNDRGQQFPAIAPGRPWCWDVGDPNLPIIQKLGLRGEDINKVKSAKPTFEWSVTCLHPYVQDSFSIGVGTDADWRLAEMWDPGAIGTKDSSVVYAGPPLKAGDMYYMRLRVHNGKAWSDWHYSRFRMAPESGK
ncbi:MAG: hypothetical protein AB1690_06065 [Candidatus Zixiibacteriota bacterium]